MNVFISYSHKDSEFAQKVAKIVEEDGYNCFFAGNMALRDSFFDAMGEAISKADAVVIILSEQSLQSHYCSLEISTILSSFEKGKYPAIIPIVIGENVHIPLELNRFIYYKIHYNKNSNNLELNNKEEQSILERVRIILATHNAKLKSVAEEKKQSEERVKVGLSNYINDVFASLKENEKRNRKLAFWLYFLSILTLIFTIVIAVVFFVNRDFNSDNVFTAIVFSVAFLSIEILIISLSKLFFTLAKSFMAEAIRCYDRIHAISFGKFFLDAYGNEATIEEVLKAFSSWNIDNANSSFGKQSSDDFDPKLLDAIKMLKK